MNLLWEEASVVSNKSLARSFSPLQGERKREWGRKVSMIGQTNRYILKIKGTDKGFFGMTGQ